MSTRLGKFVVKSGSRKLQANEFWSATVSPQSTLMMADTITSSPQKNQIHGDKSRKKPQTKNINRSFSKTKNNKQRNKLILRQSRLSQIFSQYQNMSDKKTTTDCSRHLKQVNRNFLLNHSSKDKVKIFLYHIQQHIEKGKDPSIIDKSQLKQLYHQLKPFLKQQYTLTRSIDNYLVKSFYANLSKLLFYICLQIISHLYPIQFNPIINERQIEYYARRLGFYRLALKSCFDMGKALCKFKQYTAAKNYYYKAMKLSIVLKDKYYEQTAIDKMGICEYYLGNIDKAQYYHSNFNKLSSFKRQNILDSYSHQKEIEKLFKQKYKYQDINDTSEQCAISYNQNTNQNYSQANFKKIKSDLKDMAHYIDFRKNVFLINKKLKQMKKVGKIKYFTKKNLQTAKNFLKSPDYSPNQIIMTHQSMKRNQQQNQKAQYVQQANMISQLLHWLLQTTVKNYQLPVPF